LNPTITNYPERDLQVDLHRSEVEASHDREETEDRPEALEEVCHGFRVAAFLPAPVD
jgi:hypothetical protein